MILDHSKLAGPVERDVELAITALKKGANLLKYGRRGKPKFCPFRLSNDECFLIWYSGKEEKCIKISHISRIIRGQRTPTFQRYPRPDKEYQSFSILYKDKSLDLICKDKEEAEVWFTGLKAIILRFHRERGRTESRNDVAPSESSSPRACTQKSSPLTSSFGTADNSLKDGVDAISPNVACDIPPKLDLENAPSSTPQNVSGGSDAMDGPLKDSSMDAFRVSSSSAVSSSSQGSGHDGGDALGDVFIWGQGVGDGILGGGVHKTGSCSSVKMDSHVPKALESTVVLDVQSMACGAQHAVLVTKQGEVFSWGEELGGRLGHGVDCDVSHPKLIDRLKNINIEFVACGEYHSCAVTLSGEMYTWGGTSFKSQLLGHGNEARQWVPKKLNGILEGIHVSLVSCGPWHTAVVTSAGQLFTFGDRQDENFQKIRTFPEIRRLSLSLSPLHCNEAQNPRLQYLCASDSNSMGSTSAISLCSLPKISLRSQTHKQRLEALQALSGACSNFPTALSLRRKRGLRLRSLAVKVSASSRADGGSRRSVSSRRVYRQSQSESPLSVAPLKQVASVAVPAGLFLAVTFVLWKVVEKLLTPKSKRATNVEEKTSAQGLKWSFAPGTNLLSGLSAKIDRESKERLNEFAKELRAFSVVDMSGCNFGDEGLIFLAERLAFNQTLEGVNFAGNGITATGLKAFDGILQSNIMLKTLDLSGNPIGDEGAKCLSDILVDNTGITKLQLNSTNLGDEGAKAIAEMLKKNSTLRFVELNNNMIDYAGFTSLAGALLENKTLRDIQLNGNYGGALGANALAKGLEGNKSLRELHLHGNSIGDEGTRALMSGLSQHKGKITRLEIGNNSISAKGAFHVAEYVKKSKSLLVLNISMNDIGDEGAERIGDALKENRSIKSVDVAGNNIHVKGVTSIAQTLKDNSVVTTLEIGYNPFGPEGAKVLSDVLKFHGNINNLKLGWCQIGAKGAEAIADMLKYNSTLSYLDLRGNGLRDEGAICLARSLKVVNEALTTLDLGFNEIRDDGAFAIAQALKANEDVRITSLNLSRNLMTKFGQSALTDARDHVYEMTEKEVEVIF